MVRVKRLTAYGNIFFPSDDDDEADSGSDSDGE